MKVRWVVPLLAVALVGCPPPAEPPPPPPPPPPVVPLPFEWPPVKGSQFPDLELRDATGATVRLSRFRGKTVLVEPVGMSCPGCQAFTGGNELGGGYGGVKPQEGLPGLDAILERGGIDPRHPDLVIVQVLLFDMALGTPTPADAAAWAAHFRLAERSNVVVLVGDDRLRQAKGTYELVPGFFLVDQGGMLLLDATGHQPKDDLALAVLPTLAELLGGPPAPIAATPPSSTTAATPGGASLPARESLPAYERWKRRDDCLAALAEGRWADLEEELDAARKVGRRSGTPWDWLDFLSDDLSDTDGGAEARLARLDAWVAAAPRSRWARGVRARFYVTWAWDARGSGYSDTVTQEGWRLFARRLDLARADAEAALKANPDCVPAHLALGGVARGSNVSREQATAWFEAAARVEPLLLSAYTAHLTYLMPKWHGDEESMWRFAREQIAAHPEEPALRVLTLEAHGEMGRQSGNWKGYQRANAAELLAEVEPIVARYPKAFTFVALRAGYVSYVGDRKAHLAALRLAADAGDLQTMYLAAFHSARGTDGWARDPAAALSWLARAAYSDWGKAETLLGTWYIDGEAGLTRDPAEGARWLERAAAHGDAPGMIALAMLLLEGEAAADEARARALLERAAADDDERVAEKARKVLADLTLQRGGPATGKSSVDGYEDWYPDDISPPRGTQYPCALEPLPRDLSWLPAEERRFVNHAFALILEATRARLLCLRDSPFEGAPEARYAQAVASVAERLGKERVPPGLEPFIDDVRAALDLQVRFYAAFCQAARAERARKGTLDQSDWMTLHGRFPEGRQASTRLMDAWMKLQARWGKRMTQATSDCLMHHLCALDIF